MPAENEELDVFKNKTWRPFVNTLRGAPCLHDEEVLREFDRSFIPSLRRACRLLKVRELITASIQGDLAEVDRLRREHRTQRDRAETFADQIVMNCKAGMSCLMQVVDLRHFCETGTPPRGFFQHLADTEVCNFGMGVDEVVDLHRRYAVEWQPLIANAKYQGLPWASWVKRIGVAA